jgi:hypothetical protein
VGILFFTTCNLSSMTVPEFIEQQLAKINDGDTSAEEVPNGEDPSDGEPEEEGSPPPPLTVYVAQTAVGLGNGSSVENATTLHHAINTLLLQNSNLHIIVTETISGIDIFEIPTGKMVTLEADGPDHSLEKDSSSKCPMFTIRSGASLTLQGDDDLTLEGISMNQGALISVDGIFTMHSGIITLNENDTYGGGVYVASGGVFNMHDGTISQCKADNGGGGVYVEDGTFNMIGGTIEGDGDDTKPEARFGGGIYVFKNVDSAAFNMSGGTIQYCNAESNGGGVYVLGDDASFTMSEDAKIQNNKAANGGGVSVSGGTCIMNGNSVISANTAIYADAPDTGNGGGVYVESGTFDMKSGALIGGNNLTEGNIAEWGGGLFLKDKNYFNPIESGWSITYNTATRDAGGGGIYLEGGSPPTTWEDTGDITNNYSENDTDDDVSDNYENNVS